MTDRGAIESIAEALCSQLGGDDGSSPCPYDTTAQRILDRLAAGGWTLIHVEPPTIPAQPDSVWELIRRVVTDPLVLAAVEKAERGESDAYSVVKTEALRQLEGAYVLEQVRAGNVGPIEPFPWEPVPEGSEDEQ